MSLRTADDTQNFRPNFYFLILILVLLADPSTHQGLSNHTPFRPILTGAKVPLKGHCIVIFTYDFLKL